MSQSFKELYEFAHYRLDVSERLLTRDEERLNVPDKAFEVLCALVKSGGNLVSKEDLLAKVWRDTFVEENNLEKNISRLRKILEESNGKEKFIETVRGYGYRFLADVRRIEIAEEKTGAEKDANHILSAKLSSLALPSSFSQKPERSGNNIVALAEWRREPNEAENINTTADAQAAETKQTHTLKKQTQEDNPAFIRQTQTKHLARNLSLFAVALLVVAGAAGFALRSFVSHGNSGTNSNSKNSVAAPFQAFKLKRHTETGDVYSTIISPSGKFIAYTDQKNALWLKNAATESSLKVLSESETTDN